MNNGTRAHVLIELLPPKSFPLGYATLLPWNPFWGTVVKFQVSCVAGTKLVAKNGTSVGSIPTFEIPASMTSTETFLLKEERRFAKTEPADPPPTIMKSYVVRERASGEVNTVAADREIQNKRLEILRRAPVEMDSDIAMTRISSYSSATNAYRVSP